MSRQYATKGLIASKYKFEFIFMNENRLFSISKSFYPQLLTGDINEYFLVQTYTIGFGT